MYNCSLGMSALLLGDRILAVIEVEKTPSTACPPVQASLVVLTNFGLVPEEAGCDDHEQDVIISVMDALKTKSHALL